LTNENICDCNATFVWEPSIIKTNSIEAATEAACIILSVDETVKNPKSDSKIPDEYMPGNQQRQRGLPGMGPSF